jgi:hypothetical protein
MTFASARQIIVMTLVTAALLFAIDRIKNPHPAVIADDHLSLSAETENAAIHLWLTGECFDGCRTGLGEALSELPWLEAPETVEHKPSAATDAGSDGPIKRQGREVVVRIKDPARNLKSIDFVTVLAALHKSGFAASQMEFSGLKHYRLVADLPHLCSPECVSGTRQAMDDLVRASRPKGWFRWLDSYTFDGVNQALLFYPRMGETVDIMEVLGAINSIGFEPSALSVRLHDSTT